GDKVRVVPAAKDVTLAGKPVGARELKTDESGDPDVLQIGNLGFFVIKRGDRFGIRIKDPDSPVRKNFKGIPTFPPRQDHRLIADFFPYDPPHSVPIPTILGTTEMMESPGFVKFTLAGQELTLEPVIEDPQHPELFFVFKDGTTGK